MLFIVMTTSSQNPERSDQYFNRFFDFSLAGSPPPSVNSIYNNLLRIKVPTTPFTHPYTPIHTLFYSFYWSARSLRMHSSWKRVPCLTRLLFGRHWLFVCVISFFIRPLARCSLVKYPRKQWNPPSSHFFRTVKWSTCAPFSEVRRRVKLIFVPHQ